MEVGLEVEEVASAGAEELFDKVGIFDSAWDLPKIFAPSHCYTLLGYKDEGAVAGIVQFEDLSLVSVQIAPYDTAREQTWAWLGWWSHSSRNFCGFLCLNR